MSAGFPILPGDMVIVDWAAKPEGSCALGNCLPLVAVGTSLNMTGAKWIGVNGKPGFDGWWTYQYKAHPVLAGDAQSPVYVGLGVTRFGPQYPDTALGLDCLHITIMPSAE
jgi:hypothetical protein